MSCYRFIYFSILLLQLTFGFHFWTTAVTAESLPPPLLVIDDTTKTKDVSQMEPCPPDSITFGDKCECFHELCEKPLCNYTLTQLTDSTDVPGRCCPIYSCIGCPNDTTINDQCPCAEGAVISSYGKCECVDPTKTLIDGKCTCDPEKCQLPHLCDKNSVEVKENDNEGCCTVTKCIPCPEDSHPTSYEDQAVEDKCVCLPCPSKTCSQNETAIVFRRGNNFPGTCCDLYTCEPVGEITGCKSNGTTYKEGDTWSPVKGETCHCQNGISICSSTENDEKHEYCISDGKMVSHGTSWLEDDECTNCTCFNGETKCISYFCDVLEGKIDNPSKETHASCVTDDITHAHMDSWTSVDGCSHCVCFMGEIKCTQQPCKEESGSKSCLMEGRSYDHEETWSKGLCTRCTCTNGEISCTKNESYCNNMCVSKDNVTYPEKSLWKEDDCTSCTCIFGNAKCTNICVTTAPDCPPVEPCKKKCEYGYKMNRKGCEICKCRAPINGSSFKEDYPILVSVFKKYNLSESDAINILKGAIEKGSNSYTTNVNKEDEKEIGENDGIPKTTTNSNSFLENPSSSDVPAEENVNEDREKLSMFFVGFSGGVLLALVFAISMCVFRIHKQRTKQKFSPCDYKPVDLIEMDKNKNISNIYTQKNFELKNVA
ncbi:cysteine-rich motor neuron 1 protein-like [Agrilus planipennis]|uniref:Cysteine-rich motor neuron 1 protein-like n=1 Tax=Agrilus planipennis TaxID=224129 RepID=A0A1W4WC57_AGRPL|nr:cysteine-rich motor neuron 1 protein-like [Agrilus planipennis]